MKYIFISYFIITYYISYLTSKFFAFIRLYSYICVEFCNSDMSCGLLYVNTTYREKEKIIS